MVQSKSVSRDNALWQTLLDSERSFITSRQGFIVGCVDRIAVLRNALQDPAQRGTALRVLFYLKDEERQQLFDQLVILSSVGHADIGLCREVIHSLSREWVVSNIERSAESLLNNGAHEEYRRILELYLELDRDLTHKLATRALQNDDASIREAGEDFIEKLRKE